MTPNRFHLTEAIEVLANTPRTLTALMTGLSEPWLADREKEGAWSAAEVVAHLIEAERTNWTPRLRHLLAEGDGRPFPPFDREAHMRQAPQPIDESLLTFASLRADSLAWLRDAFGGADDARLDLVGRHPDFGAVRAKELIAAWVAHDLSHIAQIVRTMAERYRTDIGPWIAYLGIYRPRAGDSIE